MKKLLSLIVITMMLACAVIPSHALDSNGSIGIVPCVDTAPAVDGVVDSIYNSGLKFVMSKTSTDFAYSDSENATPTVYMAYHGNMLYICVDVEYDTMLEPHNEYMDAWRQECVEVFIDWYNDSDLGDVKVGKDNNIVIQNLIQYRVDLDGHATGGTVINDTKNTSFNGTNPYFYGAAVKSDDLLHCTYEFGIIPQIPLTEGTHIGINIVVQDLINSGANFNWYRHADNWKAGLYPYFEVGESTPAITEPETTIPETTCPGPVTTCPDPVTTGPRHVSPHTSDVALIASASLFVLAAATIVIAKSRKR